MNALIVGLFLLLAQVTHANNTEFVSVCDRTYAIRIVLMHELKMRDCRTISAENLKAVRILNLNTNNYGGIGSFSQNLYKISARDLQGLSNLTQFVINGSDIRELPEDLFSGTPLLETVVITKTKIRTLPEKFFHGLSKLRSISLSQNKIDSVAPNQFQSLPTLYSVDLSQNRLLEIPEGLFQELPQLSTVNLKNNTLEFLYPKTFNNIPKLASLELSGNELTILPDGLFANSSNSVSLQLSYNPIVYVSAETLKPIGKGYVYITSDLVTEEVLNALKTAFNGRVYNSRLPNN